MSKEDGNFVRMQEFWSDFSEAWALWTSSFCRQANVLNLAEVCNFVFISSNSSGLQMLTGTEDIVCKIVCMFLWTYYYDEKRQSNDV